MKVVILCGGLGSRLADETKLKPKPMVKICNKPILSHITEIYERNGFREFIFALGYTIIFQLVFNNKNNQLKILKGRQIILFNFVVLYK